MHANLGNGSPQAKGEKIGAFGRVLLFFLRPVPSHACTQNRHLFCFARARHFHVFHYFHLLVLSHASTQTIFLAAIFATFHAHILFFFQ